MLKINFILYFLINKNIKNILDNSNLVKIRFCSISVPAWNVLFKQFNHFIICNQICGFVSISREFG